MGKVKDKSVYYRFYESAEDYIKKGDSIQSSEKLYKCAEEGIKSLAKYYELPEYKEAKNNGRWDARLLFSAVRNLSQEIEPELVNWWQSAWFLHVEGFHEMRLNIDEVKFRLSSVKKLIEIIQN